MKYKFNTTLVRGNVLGLCLLGFCGSKIPELGIIGCVGTEVGVLFKPNASKLAKFCDTGGGAVVLVEVNGSEPEEN